MHMFDQTTSMLPFATRTDTLEAIKKANAKASYVDAFLAILLAEHNAVGARAQLKPLCVEHVREQLLEDDGAPLDSGAGEGLRESSGSVRNRALPCRIANVRTVVPLDALHAELGPRGMADRC